MSGAGFIERSQPRERDDAPLLALDDRAPPQGEAGPGPQSDLPLDAAPSSDEIATTIEADLVSKLGRHLTEATKDLLELQAARARGDKLAFQAAASRLVANTNDVAPWARRLERTATTL